MTRLSWMAAFALVVGLPQAVAASCAVVSGVAPPASCAGNPQCQCLTTVESICHPSDKILETFIARGGCDAFGRPLNRVRPRLAFGGTYQSFEWGEIAHYSRFAGGAESPDFMLSAFRPKSSTPPGDRLKMINVRWGPTTPHAYDKFIIRWDLENNEASVATQHKDDKQQDEAGTGESGSYRFDASDEGTYAIYIEGCNEDILGTSCDHGWSFPVYVDHLPRPLQPVPPPATNPAIFQASNGIVDMPDLAKVSFEEEFRILARQCGDLREIGEDHDHHGELNGTPSLAWLRIADLIDVFPLPVSLPNQITPPHITDPLRGKNCYKAPADLRVAVNEAILASEQVTRVGTDASGLARTAVAAALGMSIAAMLIILGLPFFTTLLGPIAAAIGIGVGALAGLLLLKSVPGDYDMRLVDYVAIYHLHGSKLSTPARDYLVNTLLSERGGEDERIEELHISGLWTPIPETENHIWSTEVSRYLTNNILYDRKPDDEYDNDKNGMTEWILAGLQQFLIDDFYELNSRPYATTSFHALQTLANFAAVGAGQCTQLVDPAAPPQSSRCDVRRAARSVLDYVSARFALSSSDLRRAVPFRRKPEFRNYPRLLTNGGDDMTWRLWGYTGGSDFVREERNGLMMESADGAISSAIRGSYRPPLLITDLMRSASNAGELDIQRFRSRARGSRTAEVYYRTSEYLLSSGGRFEDGKGFVSDWFASEENAWALPTTLMPRAQGEDSRDFVRIAGSTNPRDRHNLCVGPGFACGMNPVVPPGLPDACQRKIDNWTFIDFTLETKECPFGYGYYVAVYKERCSSDDCEDAAGDPEPGSFGFFEATPWRAFESYVSDVLALNGPEDFVFGKVNVYRSPTGRHISFVVDGNEDDWDIVSYGNVGSVTTPERAFDKWPIAQGQAVSSRKPACLFIDNLHLGQRLIIDHTKRMKPRRSVISLAMQQRCDCPLVDECLSPRAE